MRATVLVRLKQEVLDPQGDAVKRALGTLGFDGVRGVRIGKLVEDGPLQPHRVEREGPGEPGVGRLGRPRLAGQL